MLINFWECPHGDAYKENVGSDDNPDYVWEYCCNHPEAEDGRRCGLDNKWPSCEDDCKLLDIQEDEK